MENSMKAYAYQSNEYPQKAKGMSFFAFIFSIFVYISIFYIFNLSPSALFHNNKFWFFISNTLILIITVDYGAFSSSKEKQDLYDDYVMHCQARNSSSFVSQFQEIVNKSIPEEEVENLQEKNETVAPKSELPESKWEIIIKNDQRKLSCNSQDKLHELDVAEDIRRSNSDKSKLLGDDENKNVLRRSETEKHEPAEEENGFSLMLENEKHEPSAEENEFSTMSDEELNRRVEEFIQRFNRQIRLQRG